MAAVGSYNLWDELILKLEVQFIQKHYGENISITVFTYDPASTLIRDPSISYASYFPNDLRHHFFRNIGYFFHNIWIIARADVLIVGGGGIIFDNEPGVSVWWLFVQWAMRIKTARIFHTILLFWGIGLELTDITNKMRLKSLFEPGDLLLVRDSQSKWLLDALEIPSIQVHDIVYLYDVPELAKPISPVKLVGISIRWGFLGYRDIVIPDMYDHLVTMGYKPIFLVFSTSGDEGQNDLTYIRKVMLGKTYNTTKNITQTLDMIPFLYAMIGMRLHAGILACVHEIPYLPISYGPKTDDLIYTLGIEHLALIAKSITIEGFDSNWQSLVSNYDNEKMNMRDRHLSIRDQLIKTLRNI